MALRCGGQGVDPADRLAHCRDAFLDHPALGVGDRHATLQRDAQVADFVAQIVEGGQQRPIAGELFGFDEANLGLDGVTQGIEPA